MVVIQGNVAFCFLFAEKTWACLRYSFGNLGVSFALVLFRELGCFGFVWLPAISFFVHMLSRSGELELFGRWWF